MRDVLIVGGGPAGMSAALILGRACKDVVIADAGPPRNAAADAVNGFLTQDGVAPEQMRATAAQELARYRVERVEARVSAIEGARGEFVATLEDDRTLRAKRVVLATGMVDEMTERPGFRALFGRSVFLCPYCHGWEVRGGALALELTNADWLEHALFLTGWSRDLIVFAPPGAVVPDEVRARYRAAGVRLDPRAIVGLRERDGRLEGLLLDDGEVVARDALFTRFPQGQTPLVEGLRLATTADGFVEVSPTGETSTPGIYAAGDLTTMQQGAMLAAAAGARAAYALNHELTMDELARSAG